VTAPPYRTLVDIAAPPEVVCPYLTRAEAIVAWMGDYAVLDAVPGGVFHLDLNGVPVRGNYLELDPPHRLLISWATPAPTGSPRQQHRRDHPHPDPGRHPRHRGTPRPAD
jgi:uncharacterized protein YndB with AHSA1/START domain